MEKLIENLMKNPLSTKNPCELLIKRERVIELLNEIRKVLFLGYYEKCYCDVRDYLQIKLIKIKNDLIDLLMILENNRQIAVKIADNFVMKIGEIKKMLFQDIEAFLNSDPAANGIEEIILSYPGLYAISVYRIAHELHLMKVRCLPRIMSEHAHSKTGIDIHPAASIGQYFFIDHGTGIVIGETTKIGDYVKIYQGVTLGALSLSNAKDLKGIKRHPTVKNYVTIYSGASILGGETIIGENTTIGCNVFITKSIEADTTVILKSPEVIHKNKKNQISK